MFLKDFIISIVDRATGNSYRASGNVVETTGTPTPLPVGPNGIDGIEIEFGRSEKYHGLFRSFTTPLKFVKGGARIIRDLLYKLGTEVELMLVMHRLDKTFGGAWTHRFFYRGELDLSKTEDDQSTNQVTVNVMEGELVKAFRANENTVYEIPINVPEARFVKMDGINLRYNAKWVTVNETLFTASSGESEQFFSQMTMLNVEAENRALYLALSSPLAYPQAKIVDFQASELQFASAQKALSLNIKFNLSFRIRQDNDCRDTFVKVELRNQTGAVVKEFFSLHPPDGSYDQLFSISVDESFTVNEGDRVFLGFRLDCRRQLIGTGEAVITADVTESAVEIYYATRYEASYVNALPLSYVFQYLLNKMTDSALYSFVSNYLTAEWDNLLITGMDAVRRVDNPKLKISFSALYESVNVPCNVMLRIEGAVLRIEKKQEAYQSAVVSTFSEVKDVVIKPAENHQFNTVKIGWPVQKIQDINGRDEFNVTQIYTAPVKKVTKQLELVSSVIASMYEIEATRINTDGKPTTNTEVDNDCCFLHVEKNPATPGTGEPTIFTFYRLYRKTYDSITGILDTVNAFNLELSPKRCLIRHGSYLRSVFYWSSAGKLVYQSSDRNTELKTTLGTEVIEERGDQLIGDLADPLFIPLEMVGKSAIPKDIIQVMETTPNSAVSVEWRGVLWTINPTKVKINPATNAEQEFIGLLRPENDILKLIM